MGAVTFVIPGNGTDVLAGAIPLGYNVTVESVVATIDNGGGGAATGQLTVADPSGEVIAARDQAKPIPAGGSGLETWAVGLGEEQAAAAGGGLQYDVDNVGDWLVIEATANIAVAFSQPNALTFGDDPTNYTIAVNAAYGLLLTTTPDNNNDVLTVEKSSTGLWQCNGILVQTDAQGTGASRGIELDINTTSGFGIGVNAGVGSTSGPVTGLVGDAIINGNGAADAIGANAQGVVQGGATGRAIGLLARGYSAGNPAAQSLPILCQDHNGNPIFEVRDDGSVHIPAGTAVIADL